MKELKRIAFLGLGNMGEPMANVLLKAGYSVTIMPHRRMEPAQRLKAVGATIASSKEELVQNADMMISMLPNLPEIREMLLGEDGITSILMQPTILLNMSTVSHSGIRTLADELRAYDIRVLDAPVSGGPARATDGTLTIMAGGEMDLFSECEDVLHTLGKFVYYTGALGTGQVAKLCNNMMFAAITAITSEALTVGVKAGVDAETLRSIILQSTGGNYALENWLPKTVMQNQYDPQFALKLMFKDLGLARDLGKEEGVPLFMGNLAHELYSLFNNEEFREKDLSIISTLYQNAAGINIADGKPREKTEIK